MGDVRPSPEQDGKGRFIAGNSGNGGRPKGARAKLGEAFLKALEADFAANGAEAIANCRDDKPDAYVKVVASLLPKEIDLGEETTQRMVEVLFRGTGRAS